MKTVIKRVKTLLFTLGFASMFVAPIFVVAAPQPTYAVDDVAECERGLLGLPNWFRGVVKVEANTCVIMSPTEINPASPSDFIWRIVLNVVEMGLFIVGYIALFFVLYGGFQFLTGGSNPSQTEKARKTILNAVIGLAISMASIGIVNLIFRVING